MGSRREIDLTEIRISNLELRINGYEKAINVLNEKYVDRGKSLNKLWEKGKELTKEIVRLKEFCGKLTYDVARLHLENRIIIPTRLINCEAKQFLVRDILRQLINESGYNLEFKVLQKQPSLIVTGKQIK